MSWSLFFFLFVFVSGSYLKSYADVCSYAPIGAGVVFEVVPRRMDVPVRAWHVRLPQRLRHAPVCTSICTRTYAPPIACSRLACSPSSTSPPCSCVCMCVCVLMYAAGMLAFLNASAMLLCVRMLTYPEVCSPYADACSPSSTRPSCSCVCVSSNLI